MIDRSTNIAAALRKRQRGFILNPYRFGSAGDPTTDPYFANVVALLHFDGSDGSTTFTDSGPNGETFTATGDAAIQTEQSKFGGSSFLTSNGSAACANESPFFFTNANFTLEAWVYMTTVAGSTNYAIAALWGGSSALQSFTWYIREAGGAPRQHITIRPSATNLTMHMNDIAVPLDEWVHLAVCRDSTIWRMYINGVSGGQTGTHPTTSTLKSSATDFAVGNQSSTGTPFGAGNYIDEVRITAGVCRYTSDFTPRTTAFPETA